MKIAFSATLISQILCATLFPYHIRAAPCAEILPTLHSDTQVMDDFLRLGGKNKHMKWPVDLQPDSDWEVKTTVKFSGLGATAVGFKFWSKKRVEYVGFDGLGDNLFSEANDRAATLYGSRVDAGIVDGRWLDLKFVAANGTLSVFVEGAVVMTDLPIHGMNIHTIGWRPWRSTIDVKSVGVDECMLFPTAKRPTQSPTKGPTRSPTKAPTPSPTKRPTQSPTKGPSRSPTKVPTRSPTKAPTSSPTSVPSTVFQGQNFSINEPNISFNDFFLNFTYVVGHSTEKTNFTLYRENCTSTDNVSDIINIAHEGKEEVDVSITKTAIGKVSSLVTPSGGIEGYSKGSIKFCIEVETLLGTTSVTFQKTNVELSYDLTDNSFEVVGNTISANEIGKEETEVTTKYGVEACICTENFDCETSTEDKVFEQNKLIHICVYPNNTSELTQISNFDMKFEQNQATTYTAVRITESGSVATAGISYMEGDGDKYLVTSRLITALFEGGKISFDVVGNAQLKFKTRQLKKVENFNLRSMEEKSIGTDEGESQFKMKVKIAKAVGKVSSTESNSTSGAMVLVVGGILVLSIMFVLFKKMKN